MIDTLKLLVEGKISPKNWIKWWNENLSELENKLPRTVFLKIKPLVSNGETRAALISQNGAFEYLNKLGLDIRKSDVYNKEWVEEFGNLLKTDRKDDLFTKKTFKDTFKTLQIDFPNLYEFLSEGITKDDSIIFGVNDDILKKGRNPSELHILTKSKQIL